MKRRTKTDFGEFLVAEIRQAGMSQEEFYNAVGIKKPYFYNLLTASPPPIDLQNRMLDVLDRVTGADKERKRKFYDLAAAGRNEIPADIAKLITGHPLELDKIRDTLTTLLAVQG
ncbi:hypothetical protein [Massiliimalia massiliensis]|uniref:hypothetical protein n=1 Tax=Massiliimalia massiliensis TaxID=1852384 RepID=UPI0009841379|nr:hypothetical protein [Massiliimalia massiliensis]